MKERTKRTGKHIITDYELRSMETQGTNLKRFDPHRVPDAISYQQKLQKRMAK